MEEMDLHLISEILYSNPKSNQVMLAQGHIWGKDLGKNIQGPTSPILVTPKQDKKGLGLH